MNTEQQKQLMKKFKENNQPQRKKKFVAQAVTATMVASVIAPTVADVVNIDKVAFAAGEYTDKFAGGDGTQAKPYLISTAMQLNQIRNVRNTSGVYFKLTNNITMPKSNWTPLLKFAGHFDGGGFKIDGLFINLPTTQYVGLFGRTARGSTISNIGLTNVNVTGGNQTGGLVGFSDSSSITNAYVTGSVTGKDETGGLVGDFSYSSSITNAYATASVTGGDRTGGLVGNSAFSSSITNAYATGNVTGGHQTGGLVGMNGSKSLISNAYATGSVTGRDSTGGLVGEHLNSSSSTTNAYALNPFVQGTSDVGQVIGRDIKGSVIGSYAWEGMEFAVAKHTDQISTADALKAETYLMNNWDVEGGLKDPVWGIEEGEGLPYLLTLGETKGTEPSIWHPEKTAEEILLEQAIEAIEDAQNAINKAQVNPSDPNIADAQDAINKLPEGSEKDDLQAQLDQIIKDKAEQAQAEEDRLLAATQAVEQAEETLKQSDFDHAQGLVNALKEGDDKKALQDRLDAIQNDVIFAGGDGTQANPYLISTPMQLNQIRNVNATSNEVAKGVYFKLTNNITMPKSNWTPIPNFAGHFDGGGFEIDGLYVVTGELIAAGLFGRTATGSTISNIGLTNVNILGGNNAGGLVGSSNSSITNAYVTGNVTGGNNTGGLVGYSYSSITNAYATANVTGRDNIGGLVGYATSSITNAYATGNVTGGDDIGGLVGDMIGGPAGNMLVDVTNVYATGNVKGEGNVGGLVGDVAYNSKMGENRIINSYAFNSSVVSERDSFGAGQVHGATRAGDKSAFAWEGMIGIGTGFYRKISTENALKAETYLNSNWDMEGGLNTPVWAIDEGKDLPYLIDLGPTKSGSWDSTPGNWYTTFNDVNKEKVSLEIATKAVIRAERTRIKPDFNAAQNNVYGLKLSVEKDDLQDRLDALKTLMKAEEHLWTDAQDAVDKARENPTEENINDAQDKINKLPEGSEKDDLQAQLDQIIKDKAEQEGNEAQAEEDRLLAATQAVEQAEETLKQSDFDHAQGLVNALKEGADKKALQDRLDAIQKDVTVEGKPTDPVEPEEPEVPTESDQDKALRLATEAVEQVEQTLDLKDYYTALDLVVKLEASEAKTDLVERLETVLNQIIQAIEDKINDMKDKDLDDLEKDDLLNAIEDLNKLPNGKEVEDLKNDVEDLLEQLNKHEEDKKFLSEAERLVGLAERYERDPYIANAQRAVDKLKEGEEKEALQARLDALQTKIENAEVDKLVRAAQQAVETAARLLREPYFGRAQDAINKVPADHEQRPILQAQLDALLDNIKQAEQDKQFLDAERFVSLAEGRPSEANIARAQQAVEALPVDPRKDTLQERLDILVDYQLYGVALEAVERAEGNPTNSMIQAAQRLVDKIPSTDDRKQPLQDRLDVLVLEAEQAEQQKEAQTQLEQATKAVENAEKSKRKALIDHAQTEVDKIDSTLFKTEKDALQDRLDEVLKADLAAQIAKAEKAIENAKKFKRPAYITQAEKTILEVQDESEQARLTALLKEALGQDAEEDYTRAAETAVKLADVRASAATITKAQELIDGLKDSNPMKEALQTRLDAVSGGKGSSSALAQQAETALKIAEIRKTDATMNQAQELIDMLPDGVDKDALLERYEALVKVTEQENDPVIRLATAKLAQAERLKRNPYFAQAREAIQAMEDGELKTDYFNRLDEARLSIFEDLHIVNLERKAEKRVLYAEYQLEEGYFLLAKHIIDELKEVNTSKANELLDRLNAAIALSKDNPEPKPVLDLIQKQLDKEITNQNSQVYKDFDKVFITIKDAMDAGDYHSLLGAMYAVDGLLDSYGKLYYDLIDSYIIYVDAALKMYQVTNP